MDITDQAALVLTTVGRIAWFPHLWDQDWVSMPLPTPLAKLTWSAVVAAAAYTIYRIEKESSILPFTNSASTITMAKHLTTKHLPITTLSFTAGCLISAFLEGVVGWHACIAVILTHLTLYSGKHYLVS